MTSPGAEGNIPATAPIPNIPAAPGVTEDPLLDTLPGAVIDQIESPMVMRVGVVASIQEGTQITVRISGSSVLVNCAYLFNAYFPLLGDRVIVVRQDSQWLCLGDPSGPIGSNSLLPNSSFEHPPTPPLIPTGWSINVISSGAGVPTFETAAAGSVNVTGKQIADFGTDSIGAGTSIADVYSPVVTATPDSKWTAAYWLIGAFIGTIPPLFSDLEMHIEFLDATGAVVGTNLVNAFSAGADIVGRHYRRLSLVSFPAGFVVAPANTSTARLRLRGIFNLSAATFVSFFLDQAILRQVF